MTKSEPHRRIYLDFNATAPLRPEARAAMLERLDQVGNASSIHAEGRAARAAIEDSRAAVGRLAGVAADRVTFTSGATEAAALALTPALRWGADREPPARLLIGATEHPAVANGHGFAADQVATVPVDNRGVVDLAALGRLLAQPGRSVLALQAANGETGVVQPVGAAAALIHAAGGLLVCDAVQAAGRLDCRAEVLGADLVLLSAHKIGGPQGIGAIARVDDTVRLAPLLRGGGQERGLRAGTENGAAICGFGAAARLAGARGDAVTIEALRRRLESALRERVPALAVFGEAATRLPNTTAFAVPGVSNETLLIGLDLAGFAVSTGSACSSGKVSRSAVLEAMGVDPHLSQGMLRVSVGWSSTADDVDRFVEAFDRLLTAMRRSPSRAAA